MSKGKETRQSILDTALSLVSTHGLEQITIGQLAKDLSMSKSGLFAHFRSKEQLQISVLDEASERFVATVVLPTLKHPRGEPRIRALFKNWLKWNASLAGGCIFLAAATEVDDRPGPLRDHVAQSQRDWLATIARAARIAVAEGHFRADLDCEQFAFEAEGLFFSHHLHGRLLGEPRADERLRQALDELIERSK
jgi:AcrR family transcriptional regulator